MRPADLKTKIFLDSGDPQETREAIKLLGFLDGQTTNPTLISKNPEAAAKLARGEKFSAEEIWEFYKKTVQEISQLIPKGSVSIEVYADPSTKADQMLKQAREFFAWIPPHPLSFSPFGGEGGGGAHIKFPSSVEGLKAAEAAVREGLRVNMTLCFSQEQAAAVHAATRGAQKGQVFVSPFVGRLDDRGENGMDLIKNIIRMYRGDLSSDSSPSPGEEGIRGSHVEVLTASVRSVEHILRALKLGSDIITAPFKVIKEWISSDFPPQSMGRDQGRGLKQSKHDLFSDSSPSPGEEGLKSIPYKELDFNKPWRELYQEHALTVKGMEKFSEDWKKLIS